MQATKSQLRTIAKLVDFANRMTLDGKARFSASINEFGTISFSFDNIEGLEWWQTSFYMVCVIGRKGGTTHAYGSNSYVVKYWNSWKK